MNALTFNITVPSLSALTPIGTNTYRLVVNVYNISGAPLGNSNISNSTTVDIVTTSTTFPVTIPIVDGTYTISNVVIKVFNNSVSNCCFADEVYTIINTTSGSSTALRLGIYHTTAGGREYYYQASPEFTLAFNGDKTISDNTPGLVLGTPNKSSGRNIFYQVNYAFFVDNGDGTHVYNQMQNVYWPSNTMNTIRRFSCDASKIGSLSDFESRIHGYGTNAVNFDTSTLSEILLEIRETGDVSSFRLPEWCGASRVINFANGTVAKSITNRVFGLEAINQGASPAAWQAKGAHTQTIFTPGTTQPITFRTFKWPYDLHPGDPVFTNSQLYDSLRNLIPQFALDHRSIITDEYPENSQGQDPNIEFKMYYAYQGALDRLRDANPSLQVMDTNLFGSYGIDTFDRTVEPSVVYSPKTLVAQSLSASVHKRRDPGTNSYIGTTTPFYAGNSIDVRNLNVGYYMYTGTTSNVAAEMVYCNERVKKGTKTYQGIDRERKWIAYTMPYSQSLVTRDNGSYNGVEYNRTGDLIPFPDGQIMSKFNLLVAGVSGEYYEIGFWSRLVGNGCVLWSGDRPGLDTTKMNHYSGGQPIKWRPNSGPEEDYVSGQNGAPINDGTGMLDTTLAATIDSCYAGWEACWKLIGYIDVLYFASYTSSRKSFTAVPGDAGYHLNGFGVLNNNNYAFKDALDAKAGMAIMGQGSDGKYVAIYYNGHLSHHEYEDNVTVTYGGVSINLGRVYGRKTVTKKYIVGS